MKRLLGKKAYRVALGLFMVLALLCAHFVCIAALKPRQPSAVAVGASVLEAADESVFIPLLPNEAAVPVYYQRVDVSAAGARLRWLLSYAYADAVGPVVYSFTVTYADGASETYYRAYGKVGGVVGFYAWDVAANDIVRPAQLVDPQDDFSMMSADDKLSSLIQQLQALPALETVMALADGHSAAEITAVVSVEELTDAVHAQIAHIKGSLSSRDAAALDTRLAQEAPEGWNTLAELTFYFAQVYAENLAQAQAGIDALGALETVKALEGEPFVAARIAYFMAQMYFDAFRERLTTAALSTVEEDLGTAESEAPLTRLQKLNQQAAYFVGLDYDALVGPWLREADTLNQTYSAEAVESMDITDASYDAAKSMDRSVREGLQKVKASLTAAETALFQADERVASALGALDALYAAFEKQEIPVIQAAIDSMPDDLEAAQTLINLLNGENGTAGEGENAPAPEMSEEELEALCQKLGIGIADPDAMAGWLYALIDAVADAEARIDFLTFDREDADVYLAEQLGADRVSKFTALYDMIQKLLGGASTMDALGDLSMTMKSNNAGYEAAGFSWSLNADSAPIIASVALPALTSGITDYGNGNIFKNNVTATFPGSASGKKIVVTLAPGLQIRNDGEAGFNDAIVKNAMTGHSGWVDRTVLWTGLSTALSDGKFTYEFPDGQDTITIPIEVRVQVEAWLQTIGNAGKPAIKVEMFYDNNDGQGLIARKTLQITQFTANPNLPTFFPNKNWIKSAKLGQPEYMGSDGTTALYQYRINNSAGVGRYFDQVDWYVSINKGTRLNALKTGTGMTTNPSKNPWTYTSLGDDPDDATKTLYKFTLSKANIVYYQFVPEWIFPNPPFNYGNTIVASTKKVVVDYWGQDTPITIVPGTAATNRTWVNGEFHSYDLRFTETFKLENQYLVWVNNDNTPTKPDTDRNGACDRPVYWRNDGFDDAISVIGRYALGNRKGTDSDPQVVTFHFDSTDIGVTALDIPLPGNSALTEVKYKINGSTDWITATVSLQPLDRNGAVQTDTTQLGIATITNDGTLGLGIDDHITDFQYVMPTVPGTIFLDSEVVKKSYGLYVYGHVLTNANKTVVSTVEAHTEGDETNTTGIGTINTILTPRQQSYGLTAANVQNRLPGNVFSFANKTDYADAIKPTVAPIFYIREEYGLGIESFTLVNNAGVDLVAKYGITAVLDHKEADGAWVYKVDTSVVAQQTGLAKYDAVVGMWYDNRNPGASLVDRKLTIGYKVTVPSEFRENGKYGTYVADSKGFQHPHQQRIYITSAVPLGSPANFQTISGSPISDAYDANRDGDTSGTFTDASGTHIMVSNANTYYVLQVLPQLNVQTQAKHHNAPDASYISWNQGSDALQVNVGATHSFDIRTRLQNDSITPVAAASIYQPIPKEDDYWQRIGAGTQDLSQGIMPPDWHTQGEFPWSVNLTGPATNPDPNIFDVYYGSGITPSADGPTLDAQASQFKLAADVDNWANVNCVLFKVKTGAAIPAHTTPTTNYDFVMNCVVDSSVLDGNNQLRTEIDQSISIATALCYEDLSVGEQQNKFWVYGDSAALQVCCGRINGKVYMDFNRDGSLDAALGEGVNAVHVLDGATIEIYLANNMHAPVQVSTIQADGSYSFADLRRGAAEYVLVVRRPGTTDARYTFSVQNTAIDTDGGTHHVYGANVSGDLATTIPVYAVKAPGSRDENITAGGNGIYNILLQDSEMLLLTVGKTVTGEGASQESPFTFTATFTDDTGAPLTGAIPYAGISTVMGVTAPASGVFTLNAQGQATCTLKHGQAIQWLQLPKDTRYTVVETEANQGGYTTTSTGASNQTGMTDDAEAAFVNERNASDVTLRKTVTGNTGDRSEYFKFRLNLSDASANTAYTVTWTGGTAATDIPYQGGTAHNPATITTDVDAAFNSGVAPDANASYLYLAEGESIVINKVPIGAQLSFAECDASTVVGEGYSIAYQVAGRDAAFVAGTVDAALNQVAAGAAITLTAAGSETTFRNTRLVVVPTGILLDNWPHVILLIVALGGLAKLTLRKRKRYDYKNPSHDGWE